MVEEVRTDVLERILGVTDGMAGWEGALLLQVGHCCLVAAMSADIPGQYREEVALAVIPLVP